MDINKTIELTEEDVNAAIKEYVEDKLGTEDKVSSLRFITGVRGDYDKGNAVEYVEKVYIEIK